MTLSPKLMRERLANLKGGEILVPSPALSELAGDEPGEQEGPQSVPGQKTSLNASFAHGMAGFIHRALLATNSGSRTLFRQNAHAIELRWMAGCGIVDGVGCAIACNDRAK